MEAQTETYWQGKAKRWKLIAVGFWFELEAERVVTDLLRSRLSEAEAARSRAQAEVARLQALVGHEPRG